MNTRPRYRPSSSRTSKPGFPFLGGLLTSVWALTLALGLVGAAHAQTVTVSTFAGGPFNDGPGAAAKFYNPSGVAVASDGTTYVADTENHRIRKITTAGVVSTVAGSGTRGLAEGAGTTAQFASPRGVAVDAAGTVFVADFLNHRIPKITTDGLVSTLAGSGVEGFADGAGAVAQFAYPLGVAVDSEGNVFVADQGNGRIRKITSNGLVSTLAGSGVVGFADGEGATAQFNYPTGVAVDAAGNIFVADYSNNAIRLITVNATTADFRQSWYGTTANTGNAADTADPFNTGVPNLAVFAFLGPNPNPATVKAGNLPQAQLSGGNLTTSFNQPPGVSGVTYGAEWSTTLEAGSWQALPDTGTPPRHTFSVPLGTNSQLFLRLRVTSP